MKNFVLCSSVLLLFAVNLYSQVSHSVYFSSENLIITEITAPDDNIYTKITYENLQQTDETGNPELPVRFINLIIPPDQRVREITLRLSNEEVFYIEYPVYPAQPDIPTSIYFERNDFVEPNPEVYGSEDPYPSEIVRVAHDGYFDGNNHIVTLAVHPIQYLPALNQLNFYSDIDIILDMEAATPPNIVVRNRKASNQVMYDNILLNMVDNPEDVAAYQVRQMITTQMPDIEGSERTIESYEYVIITSQALKSYFNKFIEWKKRKGIDIGVVTTEEIFAEYSGDLISGIYDDAGKVRQFLYESYLGGTVWALLAGDFSVVPIRFGCGWNSDSWTTDPINCGGNIADYKIPADLYFADFNGDWDVDGDEYYGQPYGWPYLPHDNPDYNPEIFVGRLLFSGATGVQDISNWTEKVIKYEQNPGEGDLSYLTKSFMHGADEVREQPDYVAPRLPGAFNHTIWKELPSGISQSPTFPYGAEVIAEMNNIYGGG